MYGFATAADCMTFKLAVLDADDPVSSVMESTELPDPRRLLPNEDDVPPKPAKPLLAGLDASGKRSPVRVILDNHILWYRDSFAPEVGSSSVSPVWWAEAA